MKYKARVEIAIRGEPKHNSVHRGTITAGETFEADESTGGGPPVWVKVTGRGYVCVMTETGFARAELLPDGNETKLPLPPMPTSSEAAVKAAVNSAIDNIVMELRALLEKVESMRPR